jgi:methylglutaconyl-CoA hydratase
MSQSLAVAVRGGVATVTLDRPDVHNAFDGALIEELTRAFVALGADEAVRAIVLTGAGRSFSAGADIGAMRRSLDFTAEENRADAERLATLFETIDACPRPTIARINGAAYGGGVGLVAACDLAIAAESAIFAFSEVRLGIAPAVISPYVLRRIGEAQARALFFTAARFGATRAREIGLVHQVVPADQLDAAVGAQLALLLAGAPGAIAATKALLRELRGLDTAAARAATTALIARLRTGPEGQEGLRAFLEKRPPAWVAPPEDAG